MTTIRTCLKVRSDGNVVVPVGASQAGNLVEVVVTPFSPAQAQSNGNNPTLTREQWVEKFLKLEGGITDSNFRRPDQFPLDPIPGLD